MSDIYEFVMPDRNKIANGLVAIDGNGHVVQKLYPHLIDLAGQTRNALGLSIFLSLAVGDYVDALDMPRQAKVAVLLHEESKIHRYARALVDDERGLRELLGYLKLTGVPVGDDDV